MKSLLTTAVVLTLALTGVAQDGHDHDHDHDHSKLWVADFDAAVAKAKEEKKDLFVDFTGSDWCGWCIRLDKEVFDHHAFLDEVQKKYILTKLDFPRGPEAKAKVPNPKRNEELSKKFKVSGFPTVALVTVDGELFARTGYQAGGPEKYVAHIEKIAAEGKKALAEIKKLEAEFAAAKADARPALVEKAILRLEGAKENMVGADTLVAIVKEAFTLDAENKSGLKLKAIKGLIATGLADDASIEVARELDPKNEHGVLELVVVNQCQQVRDKDGVLAALEAIEGLGAVKDKEASQFLYANAAFWNFRVLDDKEKAKAWVTKLKASGELNDRLKQLVEMIEK